MVASVPTPRSAGDRGAYDPTMTTRRLLGLGGVAAAVMIGVAVATVVVGVLETNLGVPDGSNLYLVAVAAVAIAFGTGGAVLTAVASVLVYDYLFTDPIHTLTVSDPGEWLNLVLLLFVAVTVGQLAALQRRRAETALAGERESLALFELTRAVATRETTMAALPEIASTLARHAGMNQVWFAFGGDDADERTAARSAPGSPPGPTRGYATLHGGSPKRGTASGWTLVRTPASGRAGPGPSVRHFRVRMEDAGRPIGSIWGTRERTDPEPDVPTTRLLRVAADLVAQAVAHDRLDEQRRRAEIAQQSDALKTALLESVSHDLRTPLASIRAYAGTLMDPDVRLSTVEAQASAAAIDREADRLNLLVGNLLDLSRIEGGALSAADEVLDLEDVVARAVAQVRAGGATRTLQVDVPATATVVADPVLLEQVLRNLLDNAVRHTPDPTVVRITMTPGTGDGYLRLTVEDAGAGVADSDLPRVFDRFFRAGGRRTRGGGTGIGLAIVQGFVRAMGGRVTARHSELGGLAIDLDLRAAPLPVGAESTP
jgi:two-component system sensor histidine kinase KdpD